ncbi:hypothetical protein N7478_005030 [Penicillium angulare]|uniref:uncharacterized protein n=1 Tax=Penicillium angulare TaxID=116970 RepID=UPI002540E7D1|nr:uncharacterized protein N7478_005030 [Penicillium angulare]KAJ5279658.1 hypothetical protein N7478_005030 [Penicillium angulare]
MKNKTTFSIDYKFPLVTKITDYDITFNIDANEIEDKVSMKDSWLHWKSNGLIPILDDLEQVLERLGRGIFGGNNVAGTDALEKRHKKMREVLPKFKFGTIGLGFFLTTNLLNPGAQVIKVDKKVGMRLPGNMLVVGEVIQGKDMEKKVRG